ncbi:hypothetical protein LWC33_28465 [Pseudonocardia sp. RS11V-5]|uniref:hypothetical protein n=1 Tax=Pseudonocardia terrae TaxID=2905831 RepID=UPI001E63A28B|nr:hypothetical protein [Pseudonocardia terrae]MCE3555368.1 hypothetical protein [Pseudonocardia terrae]
MTDVHPEGLVAAPVRVRARPRLGAPLWLWATISAVCSLVAVAAFVRWDPLGGTGTVADTSAASGLSAGGTTLLPLERASGPGGDLSGFAGDTVTAEGVAVQSVPAGDGFWLGPEPDQRVWVRLATQPGESPLAVAAGDRVSFTGRMVAHSDAFAGQVLPGDPAASALLSRQRAHVEVARSDVEISS